MLNATQLRFLQALALDTKARVESTTAAYFAEHFSIGARIGRRFEYTANDATRARELLESLGLEFAGDLVEGVDRAGAVLRPGLSEKIGTIAPHADSVAFQVLGSPATADTQVVPATVLGYQVAGVEEVGSIRSDLVLVVENFETFRQIRRYTWLMAMLSSDKSVLAVFRGDPRFRVDAAQQVLDRMDAPAWGFFDFDPSGLQMCAALKGLQKVVLPAMDVLERATLRGKRDDLYHQQFSGVAKVMDATQNAEIKAAWALMRRLRLGLPQEWMRDLK